MDAAYTPNLDSYLVPLIPSIKGPDEALRDVHDKICDIFWPVAIMHKNLLPLVLATENDEEITLDCQSAVAFMNCVQKAILLVGDVSAVLTAQRCAQVLTKLNPSLASLAKEKFPDAGKQLFGDGFEARLKTRSETAQTVAAAHHAGKLFFPKTASRARWASGQAVMPTTSPGNIHHGSSPSSLSTRFQTPRFQTAGSRGRGKANFPTRFSNPSQS